MLLLFYVRGCQHYLLKLLGWLLKCSKILLFPCASCNLLCGFSLLAGVCAALKRSLKLGWPLNNFLARKLPADSTTYVENNPEWKTCCINWDHECCVKAYCYYLIFFFCPLFVGIMSSLKREFKIILRQDRWYTCIYL